MEILRGAQDDKKGIRLRMTKKNCEWLIVNCQLIYDPVMLSFKASDVFWFKLIINIYTFLFKKFTIDN